MYQILLSIGPFHLLGLTIGPVHFYSYGFCLALALGVSIYLYARDAGKYIAPKLGLRWEQGFQKTIDLAVWVVLSSIAGARLFYVLENYVEFEGPNGHWYEAFFIWQGGLVYYGGLFGALLAGLFWVRKEKWPVAYSYDLVAPYILLGQAFGRVGCFLNGCCYGIEDPVHGMVFPSVGDGIPHLPTQLWELYGDLALFLTLLWLRRWTLRYPWMTLALYGATYGLLRYVIEIWRLDRSVHFLVKFRSVSQAASAILVFLSTAVMIWSFLKNRRLQSPPRA